MARWFLLWERDIPGFSNVGEMRDGAVHFDEDALIEVKDAGNDLIRVIDVNGEMLNESDPRTWKLSRADGSPSLDITAADGSLSILSFFESEEAARSSAEGFDGSDFDDGSDPDEGPEKFEDEDEEGDEDWDDGDPEDDSDDIT